MYLKITVPFLLVSVNVYTQALLPFQTVTIGDLLSYVANTHMLHDPFVRHISHLEVRQQINQWIVETSLKCLNGLIQDLFHLFLNKNHHLQILNAILEYTPLHLDMLDLPTNQLMGSYGAAKHQ